MELKQLRFFLAVAEELNYTRAAERVNIAQPALSQQILNLEHSLGTSLFSRNKRAVSLTQAGEDFLPHARRVLNAAGEAAIAVGAVREGLAGRLSIGAVYSALYAILPAVLSEFRLNHPRIEISVQEMTVAQQLQALRQGRIDLGFMRGTASVEGLCSEVLYSEPLVAVMPAADPLAQQQAVSIEEIAGRPFIAIAYENNASYSELVARLFNDAGMRPDITSRASDMHTILCLVMAGLGVSVVPASVMAVGVNGVAYRPIAGISPTIDASIAWHKDISYPFLPAFIAAARRSAPPPYSTA
jgi:DNA-binding transcriptional LysR family regulator